MQKMATRLNDGYPPEQAIQLRIGAHTADVIVDALDVYGSGVNLASRLGQLAGPGEIVVSAPVRDALADGLDADIEDLGECHLKHIATPVRAFRIGLATGASTIPVQHDFRAALAPGVAVIPPVLLGDTTAHDPLGELLAEGVIGQLSKTPHLRVISRLSCSVLRGRAVSAAQAGELLQVGYVLSGSYAMSAQRLLISVELADVRSAEVVWADRFGADSADLLQPRSEAVDRIAGAVHFAVVDTEVRRALAQPLPTLEGYSLLLGAVALMHRASRDEFDRARDMLEHLIERHRRAPSPRAWLAQWYVLKLTRGWSGSRRTEATLALDQTRRAIDLDPQCALAHTMAGFVQCHLKRNLDAAQALYDRALQANPNESLAWLFSGVLHTFKGEGGAALQASERALSLSPLDPQRYYYHSLAASAAVAAGDYERAIDWATRSLRANRMHTSTYRALAMAQALSGRVEEARLTASKLLALEPGFTVRGFLRRSPSGQFEAGRHYAQALREAGVPE